MSRSLSALAAKRITECYNELDELSDRQLFESIQAHFASHPTLQFERALKNNVNQLLEQLNSRHHEDGSSYDMFDGWGDWKKYNVSRNTLRYEFANTRIREASLGENFRHVNASLLAYTSVDDDPNVYRVEAKLLKYGDTVRVLAKADRPAYSSYTSGIYEDVGVLPEKFLKNNPMNVDECSAEITFTDHSNGKLKNLAGYVVVDTDRMSGDVIEQQEEVDIQPASKKLSDYETMMEILRSSKMYEFDGTQLTLTHYYDGDKVKLDFGYMTEDMFYDMNVSENDVAYDDAMNILGGSKEYTFDGSELMVTSYYTGDRIILDLDLMTEEQFDELSRCEELDDEYDEYLDDDFEQAVDSIGTESGMDL